MRTHNKLLIFIGICLVICCRQPSRLSTPTSNTPVDLDSGYVADSIYTNESLGLRLRFPNRMIVESHADVEKLAREGADMLRPEDSKSAKSFNENVKQEKVVFMLSTPESEAFAGAVLNLSIKKDLGDDLDQMVARTINLVESSPNSRLEGPPTKEVIGGVDFHSFVISLANESGRIFTRLRTARRNGHVITFSTSYLVEQEAMEIENIVKDLEFF